MWTHLRETVVDNKRDVKRKDRDDVDDVQNRREKQGHFGTEHKPENIRIEIK